MKQKSIVKKKQVNKKNIKYVKKNKTKKLRGGNFITNSLDEIRNYVKNEIVNILLHGQEESVKDKIENSNEFKKIDRKIDIFIDRVDSLIQKFIQTTITTIIKIATAAIPGVSAAGALLTTFINWSILTAKSFARVHDFYDIYSDMIPIITESGGQSVNILSKIEKLQSNTMSKILSKRLNEASIKLKDNNLKTGEVFDSLSKSSSKLDELSNQSQKLKNQVEETKKAVKDGNFTKVGNQMDNAKKFTQKLKNQVEETKKTVTDGNFTKVGNQMDNTKKFTQKLKIN